MGIPSSDRPPTNDDRPSGLPPTARKACPERGGPSARGRVVARDLLPLPEPPEEGTVSILHCPFNELKGNGFFYGSDALRSPLHFMRDPGTPEYLGDADYDQGH